MKNNICLFVTVSSSNDSTDNNHLNSYTSCQQVYLKKIFFLLFIIVIVFCPRVCETVSHS